MRSRILKAAVEVADAKIEKGLMSAVRGAARRGLTARRDYLDRKSGAAYREADKNYAAAIDFDDMSRRSKGVMGGMARVRSLALLGHSDEYERKGDALRDKSERTSRRLASIKKRGLLGAIKGAMQRRRKPLWNDVLPDGKKRGAAVLGRKSPLNRKALGTFADNDRPAQMRKAARALRRVAVEA